MDKIKKIFSPGSNKDDEVLYGDAEARRQASVGNTEQAGQKDVEPLRPADGHKESGGILRQIVNPGGEKYDQHAFGENATTEPVDPKLLQTHPEHSKDHTVLGQILNPGGDKYDEQRFGATASTGGDNRRESTRPEVAPDALISPDAKLATDETKKDHSILRQIINPGGENYDSVAYGKNASVVGTEEHQRQLELQNDPTRQEDRGSITRQILNPNQEKYDPVVHGAGPAAATSSTTAAQQADYAQPSQHGSAVAGAGSSTLPDRTAQQQPSTTTQTTTQTTTRSGNPQPTYQPTSQQPDNSHLGRDAAIVGGVGAAGAGTYAATRHHNEQQGYAEPPATAQSTASSAYSQPAYQSSDNSHLGRDAAIAGGLGAAGAGTYAATRRDNEPHGSSNVSTGAQGTSQTTNLQSTSEYTPQLSTDDARITDRAHPLGGKLADNHVNPISAPESTYPPQRSDESHFARDAGIAGGVGAAGAGTYALSQHNNQHDSSRITERPHPLSNRGADGHINPVSAPEAPETQADSHLHGSSHPVTGSSAGTYSTQQTGTQLNQAPADVQNATYTERAVPLSGGLFHHTSGPHSTDIANRLDPHVPGEFPTEEGDDPHGLNPAPLYARQSGSGSGATTAGAGLAGAGVGAAAFGLSDHDKSRQLPEQSTAATSHPGGQSYPVQTSTATSSAAAPSQAQPTSEHHFGRDAALGGAGLAGAGAAAYGLSEHDKARQVPEQSGAAVSQPSSQTYPTQTTTTTGTAGSSVPSQTQSTQPASEHHYGRDAALAGGAGAVGVGAYEATHGRNDTGPASKTIGPHESNVANIVDPRVQPQPEKMKESTTTGPYQSDLANKADPRVDSDASKHDKGKDAALLAGVAGGAGAGAAAGYGASQVVDEKEQKKLEKQHQKEVEKEQKQAEKEAKQQEKQHQKEVAKEEKAQQKEAEKQEKAHQKEVAKQEKQHEKEVAKQEKQHEKEAAKQEKQQEKQIAAEEKQAEKEHEKREKELAAGTGATGAAGAYEAEKHHQDSAEQQQQGRSSYDTNETGHSGERKRGLLDKILHPTRKSEDDNRVAADEDGHNKLHKKHAPKAQEQPHHGSSPLAGSNQEGLVAGPEYGGRGDGTVTEPHTGLPMNVGQHGSGAGGTDASENIPGYHQHPSAATGSESAATGPDWNAIKKENTPY